MSGVIRKDGLGWWSYKWSHNSGEDWKSLNLLYDGCTDWTKGNELTATAESCRVNQVCEFHVRQKHSNVLFGARPIGKETLGRQ